MEVISTWIMSPPHTSFTSYEGVSSVHLHLVTVPCGDGRTEAQNCETICFSQEMVVALPARTLPCITRVLVGQSGGQSSWEGIVMGFC